MRCPSDEFMTLQDVHDDETAHADGVSDDDREVAARSGVRRVGWLSFTDQWQDS